MLIPDQGEVWAQLTHVRKGLIWLRRQLRRRPDEFHRQEAVKPDSGPWRIQTSIQNRYTFYL